MEYNSFEEALKELKEIVENFENEKEIKMDELLDKYEKGMKAYNYCAKKLDDTQKKIKIIDEQFNEQKEKFGGN